MRKYLNRLLLPTGYRIEPVSRFQRELERLARREPQRFKFVQIGANDGVRFDNLYAFVTNRPCSGLVVEPLPDMFARLRANYADYPRIVPVNKAIHATAALLPLFRVATGAMGRYAGWASGIASFDRDHLLKHGIAAEDVAVEQVECAPLMQLLEETVMLDADLLQIDTEGYDTEILRMIDFGYRTVREGTDTVAWRH